MLLKERRLNLVGLVSREANGALELNSNEMERPISRRWVGSEGNSCIMKRRFGVSIVHSQILKSS